MGYVRLGGTATVRKAIRAAGGLGRNGRKAHGQISIRSPRERDGLYYLRRRLNVDRNPAHFTVPVRDGDLIVVAYRIERDS